MKSNKLNIESAAFYAKQTKKTVKENDILYTDKVINWVNSVLTPEITKVAGDVGLIVLEIPGDLYPEEDFINTLGDLLRHKGYIIRKSHDGGGIYSAVIVAWGGKDKNYILAREKKMGRTYGF